MPAFQFESAVFLAGCGLSSLLIYIIFRPTEGQIKLQTYNDQESNGEGMELDGEKVDPFDVTKPEDLVDGYPIDEDGFWTKVRVCLKLVGLFSSLVRTRIEFYYMEKSAGKRSPSYKVLELEPVYFQSPFLSPLSSTSTGVYRKLFLRNIYLE